MSGSSSWPDEFRTLFAEGVKRYRAGHRAVASFFTEEERSFLAGIGANSQEIFDFVEDYSHGGDPSFETVLLVTAIRREYYRNVQKGKSSDHIRDMDSFPAKAAEIDGIAWLPRIIEKARAKLRGEMPSDMMYGCGGDRPFLRRHKIHLADFLKFVWEAGDDTESIVEYLKSAGQA
ncbi:MAG: hypothetical protein CMO80_10555 [Verrucomicrobiales bacterium]|nr:hypothetical protein [Verrucomicrobiales bacterium]|tara:strand:+ start:1327 stop:1854 length:528 start_codon:yes stop_codon:yes gene_type:complete